MRSRGREYSKSSHAGNARNLRQPTFWELSRLDRLGQCYRDVPALTQSQLEVLKLLSDGQSVKEIGREHYFPRASVRNHVSSLLQVLGAHSQLEVLAKAREMDVLFG
jgi:DNA-binding NarL/FixJ family response regulator